MSIRVRWDDRMQSIIRLDFAGAWNAVDCERALGTMHDILIQSSGTLDVMIVIFDALYTDSPPVGALTVIRSVLSLTMNRAEAFIIVSDDTLLSSMVHLSETFYEYFGVKIAVVDSTDMAYTTISSRRSN